MYIQFYRINSIQAQTVMLQAGAAIKVIQHGLRGKILKQAKLFTISNTLMQALTQ